MQKQLCIIIALFTLQVHAQWVDDTRINDIVLGKSTAPIEVVEYFSFNCPHCAEFEEKTFPEIKKKYIDTGKIRWVIRDVPIDQMSLQASILARCASESQYLDLKKTLLIKQDDWAKQKDKEGYLLNILRLGGMKIEDATKMLKEKKYQDAIIKRWFDAKKKYNLMGTPAYIVDGEIHNYLIDFDKFEGIYNKRLKNYQK
jgi:protein-disulfide isomerase